MDSDTDLRGLSGVTQAVSNDVQGLIFPGLDRDSLFDVHSSNLIWKWRGTLYETMIVFTGPSMGFHVNLGEGIWLSFGIIAPEVCTYISFLHPCHTHGILTHADRHASLSMCICIYMNPYTCKYTNMHERYLHTCIHACIHTHMHVYIHTCTHK